MAPQRNQKTKYRLVYKTVYETVWNGEMDRQGTCPALFAGPIGTASQAIEAAISPADMEHEARVVQARKARAAVKRPYRGKQVLA